MLIGELVLLDSLKLTKNNIQKLIKSVKSDFTKHIYHLFFYHFSITFLYNYGRNIAKFVNTGGL